MITDDLSNGKEYQKERALFHVNPPAQNRYEIVTNFYNERDTLYQLESMMKSWLIIIVNRAGWIRS